MTTVGSDHIRIKLKAYDYRILDKAVAEIVDTATDSFWDSVTDPDLSDLEIETNLLTAITASSLLLMV